MTTWEYCQLAWMARDITEEEQRDIQQAGFEGDIREETDPLGTKAIVARTGILRVFGAPAEPFTDLDSMMQRLGLEGWELVSHSQIGSITNMYFKRAFQT